MSTQAFIEIKLIRKPDDSYFYKTLRDYQKEHTYNAVNARMTPTSIIFAAGGHTYEFELDKWSVFMRPLVG